MEVEQRGNILLIVLALVVIIGAGGYYLYGQVGSNSSLVQSDYVFGTDNPSTAVNSTSKEMTLTATVDKKGVVSGKTSPYADVFVNDVFTKADANGNFSVSLTLDEGSNILTVTANDEDGNVSEQTLSVEIQTF